MNDVIKQWGPLLGRVLISLIFIISGLGKIFQFDGQVAYAAAHGVPAANLAIMLSIVAELAGALMILVGYRARIGAAILLLWMIPVTIMMHAFWGIEDPMARQLQMIMFLKNLAMMGAMLLIMAQGPGARSLNDD